MGFTFFPSFVALVKKNQLCVECTRYLQYIANLHKSTTDGHKHNSTVVSDASPGAATPKMNKSFDHMACMSCDRACAQDGNLKRPHPTIIDKDMRWDSGWFLGGLGVGGHQTRDLLGGS